jgi:hypothetical protein
MDPQTFDQNPHRGILPRGIPAPHDSGRRVFLLASAVAAAGAVVGLGTGCDTPQGMRSPRATNVPGPGTRTGQNPAGMNGAPESTPPQAEPPKTAPKPADTTKDPAEKPQTIERPEPPSKEPAIRIKTREVPATKPFVRIEGAGPKVWIVEKGSGRGGRVVQGPVEARWSAGAWQLTEAAGTRAARVVDYPSRGTLDFTVLSDETPQIKVDGVVWPGAVRLVPAGACFDLVHDGEWPGLRRVVGQDRLGRACTEHQTLEQAVAGQSIGAVHAGGGGLAAGVQARQVGAAIHVGAHAAHEIVRSRMHRDQVAARVESVAGQHAGQPRKARAESITAPRARIQQHMAFAGARKVADDGAAHDVARGERPQRVHAIHDRAPLAIHERGALAAHRLADQVARRAGHIQRGGMELHEFQIRQRGARAPGHGHAVARGYARIACFAP